jgi:hypothetical protein
MAASSEAVEGAGEVGGHRAGQVTRFDAPGDRLRPPDLLEMLLGVAFLRARAPGQAGRDRVDRDAAGPEFHRQRSGEAHHGALAGDVGMQVTQRQRVPRLGQPQRDGLTDPARRTRDDRDAPCRPGHVASVTER